MLVPIDAKWEVVESDLSLDSDEIPGERVGLSGV
jgi:hypothetical protein